MGVNQSEQPVRIKFLPGAHEVDALPGETILQTALRAGISLTHACGSNARCSTCRTAILEGLENCSPRTEAEEEIAEHLQFKPMIRLACQTSLTGNAVVRRLVLDDEDEELAADSMSDNLVEAAGEERQVAILFADIRGFTSFAERLLPYDVIHALNRYYYRMGRIVHRHGGVVDNYMGDGILSVFGLEGTEQVVSRALQCGLEMLKAVEAMKPYFEAVHGRSFDIGLGLHYGAVVVGSIGWGVSKRRTIVGDAVNFASRVESANKNAGTSFLISEAAYDQAGHEIEVNQCPPWEIRGKSGMFQLFEVVGSRSNSTGLT
ncbi:MAG TPA: adenylate/guanylate cyclase domain-containing protein [Terrimicrobiaceae bacterium]|nr:adenylate/guanylate cyclase domain-containing protein [Terrimicrobiaceae bacterium]